MNDAMVQHTAYKNGRKGYAKEHCEYIAGEKKHENKADVVFWVDKNVPSW